MFVEVVCSRFGGLDSKPMQEVSFGVIVGGLQSLKFLGGFLSHSHDLKRNDIHLTGFN